MSVFAFIVFLFQPYSLFYFLFGCFLRLLLEAVEKHYDIALVKIRRPGCALQNCVIQYLPLFIHATKIAKVMKSCNFINKNSRCLIPMIFQRRFRPLYVEIQVAGESAVYNLLHRHGT